MISSAVASVRGYYSSLSENTRTAWHWDILSGLFAGLYQGCIWTFVPKIARHDMHASDAHMAWIAAAPAIGFIFSAIWARQMDGKNKLPFCYITWLIGRGLFMLAPLIATRESYVFMICFTQLIFSVANPAYAAVMKDIYPDHQRGRLMSVVRIVFNVMVLFSAMAVGRMLDASWIDWRIAFVFGGIFGVTTSYTFSRIPMSRSTAPDRPRTSTLAFLRDTFGILARNPGYRWYTASVFVYGFGNLVASTIYPIFQVDRLNVSNADVANLQNIGAIATISGFFFWGKFLDRRGPLITVLVAIGIICITPLCYMMASDLKLLYLASAATGIAASGIDLGYLNTTLMFAEEGKAAQYQSLHSTFFGIRGTIAPILAIPLMKAVGFELTFVLSLIVMLCGAGLQLVSMRDFRRQANEARALSRR